MNPGCLNPCARLRLVLPGRAADVHSGVSRCVACVDSTKMPRLLRDAQNSLCDHLSVLRVAAGMSGALWGPFTRRRTARFVRSCERPSPAALSPASRHVRMVAPGLAGLRFCVSLPHCTSGAPSTSRQAPPGRMRLSHPVRCTSAIACVRSVYMPRLLRAESSPKAAGCDGLPLVPLAETSARDVCDSWS